MDSWVASRLSHQSWPRALALAANATILGAEPAEAELAAAEAIGT